MRCNKCNTENVEGARFCQLCGAPLVDKQSGYTSAPISTKKDKSSLIITIWAGVLLLLSLLHIANNLLLGRVITDHWVYPLIFGEIISLVSILINILPIFCIKKKSLKIVGFIVMLLAIAVNLMFIIFNVIEIYHIYY